LGYCKKSYTEGGLADPEWNTLLGNIFMLQDVISLKPNVISAVYMGNGVLWSLSYEWWFYILLLFCQNIAPSKINFGLLFLLLQLQYPILFTHFFLNRSYVLCYLVTGVQFAEIYSKRSVYSFETHAYTNHHNSSFRLNLYINFEYTKVYNYPLVAYPFIELRNFVFAFGNVSRNYLEQFELVWF
jgi:hypothetical protein